MLVVGEEFRHRGAPPVGLADRPDEAPRPELLRLRDEPVELRARAVAGAGVDAANDPGVIDNAPEGVEAGIAERIGQLGNLEAVAEVGLVGAVAREGVVIREARQRQLDRDPGRAEHVGEHPLIDIEDVLALDE